MLRRPFERPHPWALATLIHPDLIFPHVDAPGATEALRFFAARIAEQSGLEADAVFDGLAEREKLGSTGIGGTVAIPHCRMKGLKSAFLAVGISPSGVDFAAADGKPVHLFFVIVSPQSDPQQNLKFLSAISRWVKEDGNVDKVVSLSDPKEIRSVLEDVPGC